MKYVIIGGDAAGMSAAMQIYRLDADARITVLERGQNFSYAQCGLPYWIGGIIAEEQNLIVRSGQTYRKKYQIDARNDHEVLEVDCRNRVVSGMELKTKTPFSISYDRLLIASGASPVVPQWEGVNLGNVHTLKTIPDGRQIISSLKQTGKKVAIIGGGSLGLEMAENFRKLGKNVFLIERGTHVCKIFDADMAKYIHKEAEKHGVTLYTEENVTALIGTGGKVTAVQTNRALRPADFVLISAGVRPNTDFLHGTPVQTAENGAILVDRYMKTNVNDVFAAGDCALQHHRLKKRLVYYPLGTNANKQGRLAGKNMAGQQRPYAGIVGTSILKFFDLILARTGFSEKEAKEENISVGTAKIAATDHAAYYPDAKDLILKIVYEKSSGRLLGAQAIGKQGADKRIDVIAAALFQGLTVKDLEDLDLGYAPPYNSVWDPIQQAARRSFR